MTPRSSPSLRPAPLWADGQAKPGGVHSSCSSRASVTSARPFGPKGRGIGLYGPGRAREDSPSARVLTLVTTKLSGGTPRR